MRGTVSGKRKDTRSWIVTTAPVAELHVWQEDGRAVVDVRPERAQPERQVPEKPEVPSEMVLEGHAGGPRRDIGLLDWEARTVGRHETRVVVHAVDRRQASDEALRVRPHARLPPRDVASVEDDVHYRAPAAVGGPGRPRAPRSRRRQTDAGTGRSTTSAIA